MKISNSVRVVLIISSLLAVSCGSGYRRPESVEEKMARFEPKKEKINSVPQLTIVPYKFAEKVADRTPASIKASKKESSEYSEVSNKRLYFITLLSQYYDLRPYASFNSPTITMCPNFHTNVLTFNETKFFNEDKKTITFITPKSSDLHSDEWTQNYPELYLPLTKEAPLPRVIDLLRKENGITEGKPLITKAIDTHINKIQDELKELCEFGTSDNYFTFENLVAHVKGLNKKSPPSKEQLEVLMKTSLFTNMVVMSSLERISERKQTRSIASEKDSIYSEELIKRLNAEWTQGYLTNIAGKK